MSDFEVSAETRNETGKGAMRRLRTTGKVPGVMYGAGDDPVNIMLKSNELRKQLENEAFFSHILTVSVDGKKTQAIIKDMQRNPANMEVTHVDFLRIKATEELTMRVPLHFVNEETAPGVKAGGVFSHLLNDVEISCLPVNLPEYIEVDVGAMDVGDNLHLSDLVMPANVSMTADVSDHDHDHTVASLYIPAALDTGDDEADGEEVSPDVPTASDEADAEGSDES